MMRIPRLLAVLATLFLLVACAATPPSAPEVKSAHGPKIEAWHTANGARVLYVNAPQLPMFDVQVVFDAGSARDGDKPGLASLVNGMLDQGAGEWDTDTIAERFESVGANFSSSAGRDMASVSLRSLTDPKWMEQAVATLQAILEAPRFPQKELERLRRQTLIAIKASEQSPSDIASKAFYRALYGEHPYAHPAIGTRASVKRITRDDLLAFHRRYYVANNALVVIVGDLDRPAAEALAERLVGRLPTGEKALALPDPAPVAQARTVRKAYPSTQTHIIVGQIGMRRGDPDYFPLYVGNHILGGSGFSSRILKIIRDQHGLAYSAYSYLVPMRAAGPFVMGLQTKNASREQALELLDETLRRFIAEGPTAKELTHAQKNITGGFPLRIDSNSDIAGYVAMIGFYDLPLDYLQTFNARIEAVTAEQIRDAFRRRIDPDRLVTVMVGKGL